MNAFLTELGKGLAGRWAAALLPSGLVFLAALCVGSTLGHRDWHELSRLADRADRLAGQPGAHTPGILLLATAGVLLAAAGLGAAVQALGHVVQRGWQGEWPVAAARPGRQLTLRRRARWDLAEQRYADALRPVALQVAARGRGSLSSSESSLMDRELAQAQREASRLLLLRNRISLFPPGSPTWIGDRFHSVGMRIHAVYALDLDSAWSRLWLVLPESARAELRGSREAYDAAARLTAWSLPYLLLGLRWWPALLIAVALPVVGSRRGRTAADSLGELVEASVDLHGRDLAHTLGIGCEGPLSPEVGRAVTTLLRKGS